MGKQWKQWLTLFFLSSKITADGGCQHEIKGRLILRKKVMISLDSILESRDITLLTFADNVLPHQSYCFSSSHVWIQELDHKES